MGASAAASASACAALSGACARGCCVSTSSSQASTRAARLGLEGATPGATPAELLSAPKSEGEFPDLPWGTPVDADKVRDYLTNAMQERVLVLDGAMGTTIQQ